MERSEHECNVELSLALVPSQGNQSNDMVLKPSQVLLPQLNVQDRQQSKRPRLAEEETSYHSGNEEGSRKKLRLTQEQASMLENAFEEHTTLNVYQKHELAEKLNLKPRQVEVWFQNRRARNKTKQTEVEFELLKKWCEILKEENLRLKNSLKELSSKDSCGHNGTASGKKSNCTEDSSVDY